VHHKGEKLLHGISYIYPSSPVLFRRACAFRESIGSRKLGEGSIAGCQDTFGNAWSSLRPCNAQIQSQIVSNKNWKGKAYLQAKEHTLYPGGTPLLEGKFC